MNKPSKKYYSLSAIAGSAIGLIVIAAEYKVWVKYFSTGQIEYISEKYNFACTASCAIAAHLGFVLLGGCALFLGIHAVYRLTQRSNV